MHEKVGIGPSVLERLYPQKKGGSDDLMQLRAATRRFVNAARYRASRLKLLSVPAIGPPTISGGAHDERSVVQGTGYDPKGNLALVRYDPSVIDVDALGEIEVVNNNERTPMVLILDTSDSTAGAPNRELNAGIRALHAELLADAVARNRIEIAIVTFGGSVRVSDFVPADAFCPPTLRAGGNTPMGEAIIRALDLLKRQTQRYNQFGIPSTRPIVVLETDGKPTDEWRAAAARVRAEDQARLIAFFAVGVRGADMGVLSQIAPADRPPLMLDGLKFTEFFLWLSVNVVRLSQSAVGQQVTLTPPTGWANITT